jgi:hypothetical protein
MYGDNDHRYEPSTSEPRASVFLLQPDKTYFWKSTWDSEFRTTVSEVGLRSDAVLQPRQNSRRALQAEPAVCLSRRTQRTERYRVGLGPRRDLSQRLARTPAAASIARQRAAVRRASDATRNPGCPSHSRASGCPGAAKIPLARVTWLRERSGNLFALSEGPPRSDGRRAARRVRRV